MEWIKTSERKPENTQSVLVFCPSNSKIGEMFEAEYEDNKWWTQSGQIEEEITHWMELPLPPEEGV